MTVSDLYKRLQETHGRRESKRKTTTGGNCPLRNNPPRQATSTGPDDTQASGDQAAGDDPRREQMLEVLRASEARHKQKIRRDALIGIGDQVTVLSGEQSGCNAQVVDLDYIHSMALIELDDSRERSWFNLENLALAE